MKTILSTLTDTPEALRDEYEERDGKFYLKLDGDVPGFVPARDYGDLKQKVDRFRDGYTGVMKRAKEIAGVDEMDDDLTPLRTSMEAMKGKLAEASSGSESTEEKIQKAIRPLQEALDKSESRRVAETDRANRALLRENVGAALTKAGAHPGAMGFLLDQSEKIFEVKDDKVAARDGHRTERGEPVTPGDWASVASKEFDFAFKKSSGGGANPDGGALNNENILRNPTPEQLGAWDGKMRIVNE